MAMSRKVLMVAALAALGCEWALAKTVECTMGSLERAVELAYDVPGQAVPCEVRYAKPTEGFGWEVLWRAERESGYCEARFDEFVDKLRGLGWSCGAGTADAADTVTDEVASEPEPDPAPAETDKDPEVADEGATEEPAPAETDSSETPDTE